MANELTSAKREHVMDRMMTGFENSLVLLKNVTTPSKPPGYMKNTGDVTYIDRDHRSKAIETSDGNLENETPNDIESGRAKITRQNYITVYKEWTDVEQALEMGDESRFFEDVGNEIATTAELNFGRFALANAGMTYGDPDKTVEWADMAGAGATIQSIGGSVSKSCYFMNPFGVMNLAGSALGLNSDRLVASAWEKSQINNPLGGIQTVTSTSLTNFQSGASVDREGALAATPNATYAAHKDTMHQTLSLTGLTPSITGAVRAGDVIEWSGTGGDARSSVNINTRQTIIGQDGSPVKFRQTVVTGGDTDASGAVTVVATSPAIYDVAAGKGGYNNISAALATGDEFKILGTADKFYQPNLFFDKEAFTYATVALPKLEGHINSVRTDSGFTLRVTRAAGSLSNKHMIRFDMVPALGVTEPLKAGKGYGSKTV